MEANMGASQQSDRQDLERRIHIDLPRVLVESIALVYDDGGERVLLDAGAVTA